MHCRNILMHWEFFETSEAGLAYKASVTTSDKSSGLSRAGQSTKWS